MSGDHINSAGLALIKRFEGLRLEAYQDGVGVWTIGYGHTLGVKPGDTITAEAAEIELRHDVRRAEIAVSTFVNVDLNQNQFSACVSLAFNIGVNKFSHSSLCKLLNDGDFESAADEFHKWNHAGGRTVDGLTRRRQAEEELFRKSAPKALSQSRTMQGGSIAAASTTVYGITDQLREAQDMLYAFSYIRIAQYAMIGITLLGIAYMLYARWQDHKNGVR